MPTSILLLLLAAVPPASHAPPVPVAQDEDHYVAPARGDAPARSWERADVDPGDWGQCTFCGSDVDCEHGGEVIWHRGRKIRICANDACHEHWVSDPEQAFREFQPHAGLWDEAELEYDPLGALNLWIFLGFWVLAGLVAGSGCAYLAIARGHPPTPWFLIGLGVNVLGLLLLLTRPRGPIDALEGIPGGLKKVPRTRSPVACPGCGAENHPSASACPGCGATLSPSVSSEAHGV